MKVVLFLLVGFLISTNAAAEAGNKSSPASARLSLNAEEIKIAHARLLAAEAQLKNATAESSATETVAKVASSDQKNVVSAKADTSITDTKKINLTDTNPLRKKVSRLEAENSTLRQELNFSKDRLLVAETEVERLQSLIESRTKNILSPVAHNNRAAAVNSGFEDNSTVTSPLLSNVQKEKASADMPIVTVTARKANLRIGPSESDSPLMEVATGTRLVVETRIGEWYRIIAPTGVRAWISAKVVSFGDSSTASPNRVTRISGFDSSVEDEAFGLIANLSK